MRSLGIAAVVVVVAALLSACSSTRTRTVITTHTITEPAQTVTVTAKAATTSPAGTAADAVLILGKTWSGDHSRVTVYGYKRGAAPDAPAPDVANREWQAIDVKVCVDQAKAIVSDEPWSLIGADAGLYTPSSIGYGQFPQPAYPFGEQAVTRGQCVRGWIVFDVTRSVKIKQIEYSVTDERDDPVIARWST
jgi:hypothetical protein